MNSCSNEIFEYYKLVWLMYYELFQFIHLNVFGLSCKNLMEEIRLKFW